MSTTESIIRSGPRGGCAGSAALCLLVSFDPTAAPSATGIILPKGSVILDVLGDGGGTGGTSPTVDIGNQTTTNAYANDLVADGHAAASSSGSLGSGVLTPLTEDTEIYAGVGSSAAAGGIANATILYYRSDPLNGVNR